MACNITSGVINDCLDAQGGIETVYIANGKVESITETGGVVSAITVDGAALTPADWFEFQTPRQTSSLVETITASVEAGTVTYAQVLTLIFNKLTVEKRNIISLLSQNQYLVVVAKDNNGQYWGIGLTRGAYLTSGTVGTGVAFADASQYSLTIEGLEPQPMFEVASSIVVA